MAATCPWTNSTASPCSSNGLYVKYHVGRAQSLQTPKRWPRAARTACVVSPSRMPPSERPGTRVPARGKPAAAGTATMAAITSVTRSARLICSEYVVLGFRRGARAPRRRLQPRAPRVADAVGLDPRHDGRRDRRRRGRGRGGGRHVRSRVARRRPGRAHARGDVDAPRRLALPRPVRTACRRLPALGVRERRARPRAAPERARAGRGARPLGAACPLRRLHPRRPRELARGRAGYRVQARRRDRLGPRPSAAVARARPRPRRRPEGVLPRHDRRPGARSRAVPRDRGRAARCRHRGCVARRRVSRGARRRRGSAQLRRSRPLSRRSERPHRLAAVAQHQAVAVRDGAGALRDDRGRGGTGDPDVRRRPVRAWPGPASDPAARERLLCRRAERRRAVGLQRGGTARRPPAEPAPATRGAGALNLFDPLPDGKWSRRFSGELGAELWGGQLFELAPGQQSAYHWQVGEEEWLLILTGTPTVRTPDGEQVLRPWDLVAFPRGEAGAHQVRNETDEPVRLAFFSTLSDPEIVVYPDDDRIKAVGGWKDGKEAIRGYLERPE